MTSMTWHQMNDLDTLTYDMKALLEVVTDGLNNDVCPSNTEDSSNVIRQAIDKLEKVRSIHEQMWEQQREAQRNARADGETDEDADKEEDFDTKDLFSSEEDEEDNTELAPRFDVKEIERHEDGSATYQISGSDEEMKRLFEVFFTSALINGIKHAEGGNKKEIAKSEALEVAREFEVLMREWEISDEFDYDPVCKAKRQKLAGALEAAGL